MRLAMRAGLCRQLVSLSQQPPRVPRFVSTGAGMSVEVQFTVTTGGDVRDMAVLGAPRRIWVGGAARRERVALRVGALQRPAPAGAPQRAVHLSELTPGLPGA
jgi:hypothetical protein